MKIFRRQPDPRPLPPPSQPRQAPQPVQPTALPTLSRAQQQRMDVWLEPEERQLPATRTTYVPSGSELLRTPNVTVASPDAGITANVTPASNVDARTIGSYTDRARAWQKYAFPLCVLAAFGMTISAVALQAVPLLSAWVLVVFFSTFVLTYAPTMVIYWLISPEGVALLHTMQLWRHFFREQRHRHHIEREVFEDQRSVNQRRIGGGQ
jgi:hypothetical protein